MQEDSAPPPASTDGELATVYNITVEGVPEFFAGGILVHNCAWLDEPAHYDNIDEVWSNLLFGLRLGRHPRICATTTPKPVPWIKNLIKSPTTVSVVASTYANLDNLAPVFREHVLEMYEGTRLGRQEIHGEVLEDVEGALWTYEMIDPFRVHEAPADLDRVTVSIDPAGSASKRADETGIVVVGIKGKDVYVLEDLSGHHTPARWSAVAVSAVERWGADDIVAEKNYGGDMVSATLRNSLDESLPVPVRTVMSRRGKVIRATPVAAIFEKERGHLVGDLEELEAQLLSWVPGDPSPDRLDAMVHGITHVAKIVAPTSISTPSQLKRRPSHLEIVRTA